MPQDITPAAPLGEERRPEFRIESALASDGFTDNHRVHLFGTNCGPMNVALVPKKMGERIVALAQEVERLTKERDEAILAGGREVHKEMLARTAAEAHSAALAKRVAALESAGQALADFPWAFVSVEAEAGPDDLHALVLNLRAALSPQPSPSEAANG